jgi:hypothetical protein
VLDAKLGLLVESYKRLTGKLLLPDVSPADVAEVLWRAPFAIVAHGTQTDPLFFYGNEYALRWFEMGFEDFTRLPSRLSAEPVNQQAREQALRQVAAQGYVDGYAGMRIARSGRRFMIEQCTIWNLTDAAGMAHGQAACFIVQDQPQGE